MNATAESDALHARVRRFVRAFERGEGMPEPFDVLAADLARFQAARIPGYRRLCEARGVDATSIVRAEQAPAVPTDAFKLGNVFAFDVEDAATTFLTSGTTGGPRGTHRMRVLGTYDAASLAMVRAMFVRDLANPIVCLVVGPTTDEAPESSLAHMCALFARSFGQERQPEQTFFVRGGTLDLPSLRHAVAGLRADCPVVLLATSFALVHLLDALGGDVLALPARSRVMQTGGFKTKALEMAPSVLRQAVASVFAIDERAVVGEYGMTELSSQFWESTLVDDRSGHGVYVEPPWARVVAVDPETLIPVPAGEVGVARIEDLANVDSAFAILTRDLVRRVTGGFEVLGRSPAAPPRGCSIGLEEMLAPGRSA